MALDDGETVNEYDKQQQGIGGKGVDDVEVVVDGPSSVGVGKGHYSRQQNAADKGNPQRVFGVEGLQQVGDLD